MSDPVAVINKNTREQLRVSIDNYKDRDLISCRVWFQSQDGDYRPSKDGFALRIELLPELVAALEKAEAVAMACGLIGKREGN